MTEAPEMAAASAAAELSVGVLPLRILTLIRLSLSVKLTPSDLASRTQPSGYWMLKPGPL